MCFSLRAPSENGKSTSKWFYTRIFSQYLGTPIVWRTRAYSRNETNLVLLTKEVRKATLWIVANQITNRITDRWTSSKLFHHCAPNTSKLTQQYERIQDNCNLRKTKCKVWVYVNEELTSFMLLIEVKKKHFSQSIPKKSWLYLEVS